MSDNCSIKFHFLIIVFTIYMANLGESFTEEGMIDAYRMGSITYIMCMILMISSINWKFTSMLLTLFVFAILFIYIKDTELDALKYDYGVSSVILVSWCTSIFYNNEKISKEYFMDK